jgi:hypothetical protein
MVNATRLLSRLVLASTLFLALAACDKGAPSSPTPFGCVYTLSVTGISVPGSGASTTIGVTTTSQCAWSATSNRDWVTITEGATGTGSGTVAVVISPNPASSIRTGTLTVAGQAVSVSESGQACAVTLSPTVAAVPPGEATGSLMVAAPMDCAWTAVGSVAWLTIATGATGIGNGVIAYAVGANTGPLARSGTIAVMVLLLSSPAFAEEPTEPPTTYSPDRYPEPSAQGTVLVAGANVALVSYGLAFGSSFFWADAPTAQDLRLPVVGPSGFRQSRQ